MFYTNVNKYGNKILFRGYDSKGNEIRRKFKFEPTLFLPTTEKNTEWKALDGTPVFPKKFESMSEANDFYENHKEIQNLKVYGNTNYVAQFINHVFPDEIEYVYDYIRIGNIDIEVASDEGFPEPDEANYPVISIAYKDSKNNIYHVWGLGEFDSSKHGLDLEDAMVQYRKCDNEAELLQKFVTYWENNCPDIITGWNIRLFDVPYLVNRIEKICGSKTKNALSPWNVIKYKKVGFKYKNMDSYNIFGVSQMDYMDLFQKFGFAYGNQESYSLDNIAHSVLGEKKLSYEEHGSLHTLYKKDHQKFTSYNIKDVHLVDKLDKESQLLKLAVILAYKGGVNYNDAFGTIGIWDSFIYRYLNKQKIAVPPAKAAEKEDYPGGYVKEPRIGFSNWVASFDLNSLYPNIIIQYNMSPETLVKDDYSQPSGVDYYLENNPHKDVGDYCVAANGSRYRKDKKGVLPTLIEKLYDERRTIKKEMLKLKQENELVAEEIKRRGLK